MIRYGIVDFGLHVVRRLTPGFALGSNSHVTALLRRELKQAEASAAEYEIPHAFDSAAALCRSPEVDAVFVATPNGSHLKDVLLAIESGKPVLCEKPMGMNASRVPSDGGSCSSCQTVAWCRPGLSFRTQHRELA
jgi:predicted dehydrogenase